jgi:hypothetical protein
VLLLKWIFSGSSEWWLWHEESVQRVVVFFLRATILVAFPTGEIHDRNVCTPNLLHYVALVPFFF